MSCRALIYMLRTWSKVTGLQDDQALLASPQRCAARAFANGKQPKAVRYLSFVSIAERNCCDLLDNKPFDLLNAIRLNLNGGFPT